MLTISGHRYLYLALLVCSLVFIGLQFAPFAPALAWNKVAIVDGQWWRILTGNWLHTNGYHLLMNLLGFVIIALIFRPTAKSYVLISLLLSLLIGLNLLGSHYVEYVGLSGVLHGLFACYALKELMAGRRSSALLVIGVIAKVAYEIALDPVTPTAQLINASVAYEAHLVGVVCGLVIAWLWHKSRHAMGQLSP